MFVTVAHDISDADKFWSTAERELPKLVTALGFLEVEVVTRPPAEGRE